MPLTRSGQITVTTAGTAVKGPKVSGLNHAEQRLYNFYLTAHPSNTGAVWVGNDGADDVANTNAYPLKPGQTLAQYDIDLDQLIFDADVNGEKICWLIM